MGGIKKSVILLISNFLIKSLLYWGNWNNTDCKEFLVASTTFLSNTDVDEAAVDESLIWLNDMVNWEIERIVRQGRDIIDAAFEMENVIVLFRYCRLSSEKIPLMITNKLISLQNGKVIRNDLDITHTIEVFRRMIETHLVTLFLYEDLDSFDMNKSRRDVQDYIRIFWQGLEPDYV